MFFNKKVSPFLKGNPNHVLVIADTHEPFCKKGYLEFVRGVQEKYNCGTVIHIGDEVDNCAISRWEKDPDGLSAGSEYDRALKAMKRWYEVFPQVKVCIGNHSERMFKLAAAVGLSKKFVKPYEEIWEAPKLWAWKTSWEFSGVLYTHGTGNTSEIGAFNKAQMLRQNVVMGHIHTTAGIKFSASQKDLVWGMMVGGAVDDKAYAFTYARENLRKSIIGCGIVLDGTLPLYIPMPL